MTVHRINADALHAFVRETFLRLGCPDQSCDDATKVLIWASLRGVDTHGIRNLVPYYVDNIRNGQIDPMSPLITEHETSGTARLNGGSGLGLANAAEGMRIAILKAKSHGTGMVAIHNTHHLGPAGFYAHMALEHGMIGFCATGHFFGKGNDIGVAPINGARALFSTNPFSFAAPCKENPSFVLDMSTAIATVNRIEMLGQLCDAIPAGWAKDSSGLPTIDATAAKILNPLGGEPMTGGHKGIGLSMMVSILTGVLTSGWSQTCNGAEFDQQTMGHFLGAIRIDQFMPLKDFELAMDAYVDAIQSAQRTDSQQEIHYPGSQEHAVAERRKVDGIPVDERLLTELKLLANTMSIETNAFA